MPSIDCPIVDCAYSTGDVDVAIAAALLNVHNNVHRAAAPAATAKQKAPKLTRPSITNGSSEETWNAFHARWKLFKGGTQLTAGETTQQLFQCCDEQLGNDLLRGDPNIIANTEAEVLTAIKKLAVIPVAISVRRSDLLSIKQNDGENVRSFFARIKGKAATCSYTIVCPDSTCNQPVDFTNVIAKDVLISGLAEDEVKREVLGWPDLDSSSIEQTVSFIEAKEMAKEALNRHSSANAISSYRQRHKSKKDDRRVMCQICKTEMERLSWCKRQKRMVERKLCFTCWRQTNPRPSLKNNASSSTPGDDAGAIAIGSIEAAPVVLDHMLFVPDRGWKSTESMRHPTLTLTVSVDPDDYHHIGHPTPKARPSKVQVVTDTGAQSCLWGLSDFIRCGFSTKDLMSVKHSLFAANKEKIAVSGAILIRLTGSNPDGDTRTAAVMAYVSPSTQRFYLSREALIQLGVITKDFPRIASADEECAVNNAAAPCGCPIRSLPPSRPKELPVPRKQENIPAMREWLISYFSSSTFNQCKHQPLPGMSGPAISLHVDPNAQPHAVHTPASISLHWQDAVKEQLDADVAMGVIEKVPIGEPSLWCHRMVIARKSDGTPRRTVDLSPLNAHCLRETHHVKPPFQQAKAVPSNTWKTVTDAWNGFHSVPIRPADRHYTTFITPWGRYRYMVAPQGFLASGDGYARRFDELIADVERKSKCVDDTIMWDTQIEEHWWRVIDFLILLGQSGIILNREKFQFSEKTVNFAGFRISSSGIKPLEKFISAIKEFPTPKKTTDVRSWFGLINQVGHYNKLSNVMAPFKALLSPKTPFAWNEKLETAFKRSKEIIVDAIIEGVEIFNPERRTCLRPDWSKTGIGFFLSQKHCACPQQAPGCCPDGWKITLAGSRFLRPAETWYAPVEGEALAIAWSLEQTRFFTQGCDNLLIITDHKPLTKLFGDRTLDEITNPRLLRMKQRTLLWRFTIQHMPGKDNHFSDATSRNPVESPDENPQGGQCAGSILLSCLPIADEMEAEVAAVAAQNLRAVTWELVRRECARDQQIQRLIACITSGIRESKAEFPPDLQQFWKYRSDLYVVDGVVLMKRRIVIPQSLRPEVLQSLHSAHQGVTAMSERAKAEVYWPRITTDIHRIRDNCYDCNRIAPSQARLPPVEPSIPTTPFEAIASDYFSYKGWNYLVAADRLSAWTEIFRIRQGTPESGSRGLCTVLRTLFKTFGVPIEISSDGGPEFTARSTQSFFQRWGIHHRISSSYLPSSNGRAEVAVKAAKRLLMNNTSADGNLDTDEMVRALLMLRNTRDPSCKLSPAEILFGRRLRDSLPFLSKEISTFDNPAIAERWKEAWSLKERSLKERYVRTLEDLGAHTRTLGLLIPGDRVFIQNQAGNHPKRWDRSGIVMESKGHHQYVVKVSGSGRLTLRNRQFLRKFQPHELYPTRHTPAIPTPTGPAPSAPDAAASTISAPHAVASSPSTTHSTADSTTCASPAGASLPHVSFAVASAPSAPSVAAPIPSNAPAVSPIPHVFVEREAPVGTMVPPEKTGKQSRHADMPPPSIRRSTRLRTAKQFYDPETGTYVPQNI